MDSDPWRSSTLSSDDSQDEGGRRPEEEQRWANNDIRMAYLQVRSVQNESGVLRGASFRGREVFFSVGFAVCRMGVFSCLSPCPKGRMNSTVSQHCRFAPFGQQTKDI